MNIITLWESGQLELISSSALVFEAEQIPLSQRRTYILETLAKANLFISRSKLVEERAQRFVGLGIKPLDALHLASSIEAEADYFCTCDDRFLRRANAADTEPTKVVSPLELITEITE
ncbi:PIN domain-containing protein [Myxacorys almedinensis]|uniref:PIN domain-containing protein n=1 Tax=Myxacorys almedinensis TaxID=2651157 RepID=UPI00192EBC78|nr:PIN domain-containing protein [Myxacorys almedinensis]